MLIAHSCQNFCNINRGLLYYVWVTRVQCTVLNSRADFGGRATGHGKGQSPACTAARHSLPRGREKSRGMAATGHLGRDVSKWSRFLKGLPSSKQIPNEDMRFNSVYFILNKMGIIFEGPHKILAFTLVVSSYEMLTSVLLQCYFKSRVSRFRLNQYITEGV